LSANLVLGVAAILAVLGSACSEDVSLGAWRRLAAIKGDAGRPVTSVPTVAPPSVVPDPTPAIPTPVAPTDTLPHEPIDSGSGMSLPELMDSGLRDGSTKLELPVACDQAGDPGRLNAAGPELGATETSTDWTWSRPASGVKWTLMIERDIVRPKGAISPQSGYYWAHQFSFEQGAVGVLGLQAEGIYEPDPTDKSVREYTKMLAFWLSGPPTEAELGDIAFPDARVAPDTAVGISWLTIHVKFDWQVCHTYEMRVAPDLTEAGGDTWYGAWITDLDTSEKTYIGRMRMPAAQGQLVPYSISRTSPIEYPISSCDDPQHSLAVFGAPTDLDGNLLATVHTSRFSVPTRCPTSRVTDFGIAVRHELGVSLLDPTPVASTPMATAPGP
jgi:hypothetical protein